MGQPKMHVLHRNQVAVLQARTTGIRVLGSTALELAWVAAGRLDAAWCDGLNAWDMAAGLLFVRESGGFVAPIKGEGDPLHTFGYVAANADLLPEMKKALAEAEKL